eukprot:CAMPEP_0169087248 /NCGR_PEP_ID=MMETSP1015-20121227/14131_1 /TAXON_ID=342587 /ORGANISM="Karlodinium micrum, Strain CCMP2283" /LENGTH=52 /DNA_ID=CAMNT_0009147467 /DNA_START=748 /DNA_END=906 /DNA_ORIENTATION=-
MEGSARGLSRSEGWKRRKAAGEDMAARTSGQGAAYPPTAIPLFLREALGARQ